MTEFTFKIIPPIILLSITFFNLIFELSFFSRVEVIFKLWFFSRGSVVVTTTSTIPSFLSRIFKYSIKIFSTRKSFRLFARVIKNLEKFLEKFNLERIFSIISFFFRLVNQWTF